MQAKITKRLVDELVATEKPIFVFDTALAGFVLKVTPTGRRTYQLRYRMGGRSSPLKTYTIGVHGQLSPDQARRMAEGLVGDVRRGIDPATEKAKKKADDRGALTVETLSKEFLEIYGETKLKPRSYLEYERAFRKHLNPRIGRLKVRDVTHGEVERLHHAMKATPPNANRAIAALSKFFSWAIKGGYRPDRQNPCQGLEKYKEQGRERYLSAAEIAALGQAIRTCEDSGEITPWQAALFRVLLLSGLRRDELRTLEWRCVNFERSVIVLEDSKTGKRDVPISAPVLQILSELLRLEGNPYVFCGSKPGRPLVNVAKPWKRVLTLAGIDPARLHDLRHTAASIAVGAGASLVLIGGVLGHRNEKTTKRYAHLADDPIRATSEAIGERIAKALEGETAEVVPLKRQ
jgi:integrase